VQERRDVPAYNAFSIEKKGNLGRPGFQNGPYTAIEGFLQLRNPIMGGSVKKKEAEDNPGGAVEA
jgi:hypothetical protein